MLSFSFGLLFGGLFYFVLDFYREKIFGFLRKLMDPSGDKEEFDIDSLQKWDQIEKIFSLLCFLVLFAPLFMSVGSSYKFLLVLKLPRVRWRKGRRLGGMLRLFVGFELGYRTSCLLIDLKAGRIREALRQGLVIACVALEDRLDLVLGLLFVLHSTAFYEQHLFNLLALDALLDRRVFRLIVHAILVALLVVGSLRVAKEVLSAHWFLALLIVTLLFHLKDMYHMANGLLNRK